MLGLGVSFVLIGSCGVGFMVGQRMGRMFPNGYKHLYKPNPKHREQQKIIAVEQEDITEEEDLTIKQHFNILKLITNRRKNSIPKDKED